jgi:hypothetical protein
MNALRPVLFLAACAFLAPGRASASILFADATSTHVPDNAGVHSMDAEFGDFDKDGDLDVAVAVESGANILYLNDGSGRLAQKRNVFTSRAGDSEDLAVADFDQDGNSDIVFVDEDGGIHQLYYGNGDATFRDVSSRIPRCEANAVEAVDLTEDGWTDIVIGCAGGGSGAQDLFLVNDRKGGFADETAQRFPALTESTQDVKAADLDGDGDLDLVIGNDNQKNRLLINQGKGFFADSARNLPIPYQEETREVLLFDADNDGDKDIVFCNLTCNACGAFTRNPQARILINDGKGRFTDETQARMPPNTWSSWDGGYLDFDADGDLDLILCAIEVPGFLPLAYKAYRNDGKGRFTDETAVILPGSFVGHGWDVEVADLDKDGALDMYLCSRPGQDRFAKGLVRQPVGIRPRTGGNGKGRMGALDRALPVLAIGNHAGGPRLVLYRDGEGLRRADGRMGAPGSYPWPVSGR